LAGRNCRAEAGTRRAFELLELARREFTFCTEPEAPVEELAQFLHTLGDTDGTLEIGEEAIRFLERSSG